MGLFDRFTKPKWQHKDSKVRLKAVKELDNQEILVNIVKNDSDKDVRLAAVQKISDESILVYVAKNDSDNKIRKEAIKKINNQEVLIDIINTDKDKHVQKKAISQITDQQALKDIAKNYRMIEDNRVEAVKIITNQEILIDIAKNTSNEIVSNTAFEKLNKDNQESLMDIAINASLYSVQEKAIEYIKDQKVLGNIAKNAKSTIVKEFAVKKISSNKILSEDEELQNIKNKITKKEIKKQEELTKLEDEYLNRKYIFGSDISKPGPRESMAKSAKELERKFRAIGNNKKANQYKSEYNFYSQKVNRTWKD